MNYTKRIIALLLVSISLIIFSDFSAFSMGSNATIEEEFFEDFDRFSNSDPDAADVDFSGVVNTKDATAIQKYSSGVLAYFG